MFRLEFWIRTPDAAVTSGVSCQLPAMFVAAAACRTISSNGPEGVTGGAGRTCRVTGVDTVVAPMLSTARAVIVYEPAATFVHDTVKGLLSADPIWVGPE